MGDDRVFSTEDKNWLARPVSGEEVGAITVDGWLGEDEGVVKVTGWTSLACPCHGQPGWVVLNETGTMKAACRARLDVMGVLVEQADSMLKGDWPWR